MLKVSNSLYCQTQAEPIKKPFNFFSLEFVNAITRIFIAMYKEHAGGDITTWSYAHTGPSNGNLASKQA